jgi:carboxyl-terminal processing protease
MKIRAIILSIILAFLFAVCDKQSTEVDMSAINMNDFEAAWNRINDVYPFFDFKKIDWDSIYFVYRPRVEQAEGIEFHSVLHDLLAELKDAHVYYQLILGGPVIPYYTPRQIRDRDVFSLELVKTYFDKELRASEQGTAKYGIIADSIGYIYLSNLEYDDVTNEFPSIIEYLKNTRGLIIDLRENQGGTIQNIQVVISKFLMSQLAWPKYYFLGELLHLDPLQPSNSFTYTKPVVLIINGIVLSAGESTSEIMKQLPQVTAIGDTTAGGGGAASSHSVETMGNFDLPSGIMINIPTGYGLRYDGQHFEWNGVPPDIRVEQTKEDVHNGKDKQLEFALEFLISNF